jgi:hypothetical protein
MLWEIREEGGKRKKAGLQSTSSWTTIPEYPNQSKVIVPEF